MVWTNRFSPCWAAVATQQPRNGVLDREMWKLSNFPSRLFISSCKSDLRTSRLVRRPSSLDSRFCLRERRRGVKGHWRESQTPASPRPSVSLVKKHCHGNTTEPLQPLKYEVHLERKYIAPGNKILRMNKNPEGSFSNILINPNDTGTKQKTELTNFTRKKKEKTTTRKGFFFFANVSKLWLLVRHKPEMRLRPSRRRRLKSH